MANAGKALRRKMLVTTAVAAVAMAPGMAQAQIVSSGDLVSAIDSGGNPGAITIQNAPGGGGAGANTATITVNSQVVVADWTQFNVANGFTLNVLPVNPPGPTDPVISTLINRVVGASFSDLGGTINAANINLWIINQNGILFGDNTSISANSFFASTLDVPNQDLFDFYMGTNVVGNGTNTLSFGSGFGSSITMPLTDTASFAVSPGSADQGTMNIVGDGSLMFVSQGLSLNGTLTASGRVAFVTANQADVTFSANSPLSFSIPAGSTVATQQVNGSVTGSTVQFAMVTDTAVVNTMLIGAAVQANSAAATDTGIILFADNLGTGSANITATGRLGANRGIAINAPGAVSLAVVDADDDDDNTGNLALGLLDTPTSLALSGAVKAAGVQLNVAGGTISGGQNVTATNGGIDVDANTVTLGALQATDGITIDGNGTLNLTSANGNTDGNATGNVAIGQGTSYNTANITGAISGRTAFVRAGSIGVGGVTATAGDATLTAPVGGVTVSAISATGGNVLVEAVAGLTIGSLTATRVAAVGGAATVRSSGGGAINAGPITADGAVVIDTSGALTGGAIDAGTGSITVGGNVRPGSITLGALTADNGISLFTAGAVSVGAVDADDDNNDTGAFVVGTGANPVSQVTLGGNVKAASVSIQTGGAVIGGTRDFDVGTGGIDIDAASIALDEIVAGGGAVDLNGTTITTTSINSGGSIAATGTGALSLGALTANTGITINTPGTLAIGATNADADGGAPGALMIGNATAPSAITVGGNVSASSMSLTTGGIVSAAGRNFTATSGSLSITSTAPAGSGDITVGALTADTGITLNTLSALSFGAVDADDDDNDSGAFTVGNVSQPSVVNVGGNVKAGAISIRTSGAVNASGRTFDATGNGGMVIASTGGGNLTLGSLTSGGIVDLDTTGALVAGGVNAAGALTVGFPGNLLQSPSSVQFLGNITAGSVSIFTPGSFRAEAGDGTDRNITTTGGPLVIDALNVLAQDLTTNGSISITARQTGLAANTTVIDLGNIDTNATGDVSIKSLGNILLGNAGGGRILTGDIDARGANNNSAAGADNVFLDTSGNIQTGKIFANTLTVGGMIIPENFSRENGSKLVNEIINSSGLVNLGDTEVATSLVLTAGQIIGGTIVAGGEIDLTATGSPSLAGTITAGSFTAAGPVTLTSLDNSAITVTNFITANDGNNATTEDVTFVTNGPITFGNITATGALNLGTPSALTITGNINVGSFDYTTASNFIANDVFASSGLNINANLIQVGAVGSANGNVILTATGAVSPGTPAATILPGGVQTTSILAGGSIAVTSQNGGFLNLGGLTADAGITLSTSGAVSIGTTDADDDGDGTGDLLIGSLAQPVSSVTLTGNVSGANVNIRTGGAVSGATRNITATGGGVTVNAASILAGAVASTGGGIVLNAGPITTTSMNSDTLIDVNGTGLLNLGNLVADDGISLDTSGAIIAATIDADDDGNNVGALLVGQASTPTAITFTGNAEAATISLNASGAIGTQGLTTSGTGLNGALAVGSGGAVTLGAITSTGPVTLQGAGSVTAGEIGITGQDQSLVIAASGAGADILTGNVITNGGYLYLSAADALTTGDLTVGNSTAAVAGLAVLQSGGAMVLGAVDIDGDITASTGGSFAAASILAGDDIAIIASGPVNIAGNVATTGTGPMLNSIDISGGIPGSFGATLVPDAAGSNIAITSGSTIAAQNVSAVNGDITLLSRLAGAANTTPVITTGDVTITGSGDLVAENRLLSNALGTGRIELGQLAIAGGATLSTLGELETDQIDAASLTIATPSSVTFNGSVTAPILNISTNGGIDLGSGDLISDAVTLTADFVTAANIVANNGSVTITANGDGVTPGTGTVTTDSITATNGFIDITSLDGGALDLGTLGADAGITLDTAGTVDAATVDAGTGALVVGSALALRPSAVAFTGAVTAGSMDINTTGAFSAVGQNVTATNGTLDIDAAAVTAAIVSASGNTTITVSGAVTADQINSTGGTVGVVAGSIAGGSVSAQGNANLQAAGTITTTSVTSTTGNVTVLGTGAGLLDLGAITATNGLIDVQSNGGGALDLGDLNAGSGIALDTSGSVDAGVLDAGGGAVVIGSTAALTPSSVTVTGAVSGSAVTINTSGNFNATGQTVTAETGALAITAADITAAAISAVGNANLTSSGTIAAGSVGSTGGNVTINTAIFDGGTIAAAQDVLLTASGTVDATSITATNGSVTASGSALDVPIITAGQNVSLTFTGNVDTDTITATAGTVTVGGAILDLGAVSGGTNIGLTATGDLITTSVASTNGSITASGATIDGGTLSAGQGITLTSPGSIDTVSMAATAGSILANGASIDGGVLNAGQNITLTSAGAITTTSADAAAGLLVIDGASIDGGVLSAGQSATLTATGGITTTSIDADTGSITASGATIDGGVLTAGQNVTLTSPGAITTTSITGTAGLIDVASTGGGALDLGNLDAGNGIELDTSSTVAAGSADAGSGALRVGTAAAPVASATFTGALSGQSISIFADGAFDASGQTLTANGGAIELFAQTVDAGDTNASGNLTIETEGDASFAGIGAADLDALVGGTLSVAGDLDASGAALIQASDVEFGGNVSVQGSELVFRPLAGLTVGLGVAEGDFTLSTEEIGRINADRLVIDAADQDIGIDTVTFGSNAGSSEVIIATTGSIAITGDLIGEGAGRTFRLGGDVDGTDGVIATRLTADIDTSEVNIGDSLLDLRAADIVFGRANLIDAVAPLTNDQIADQFVGNSASDLYNPLFAGALSEKLTSQPTYLRAGNLSVTYSNSALFQNSSIAAGLFTGVQLGEVRGDGILTVNPIDNTNTFAYFGQINLLTGQTVALAGGAVIVINDNTDISASRVNGCIISSGADCRTTIVGTTIIEVPREATSVLIADDGLLIPFDPLVGTNNEGLFADAATDPEPDCIPGEGKECPEE